MHIVLIVVLIHRLTVVVCGIIPRHIMYGVDRNLAILVQIWVPYGFQTPTAGGLAALAPQIYTRDCRLIYVADS